MDRAEVERRSAVVLVLLSRQPRWLLGLVVAALLGAAVFAPAPLAVGCLFVLVAALSWLSYLSWPVTPASGRLLRTAAIVVITAVGLQRALG